MPIGHARSTHDSEQLFADRAFRGSGESDTAHARRHSGVVDECELDFEGSLTFADQPRTSARHSIERLEGLGIEVKIITGGNGLVAAKVC